MTTNNSQMGKKVALITNGTSGLGRATATRFMQMGYEVSTTDSQRQAGEKSYIHHGHLVLFADFDNDQQVKKIVEKVIRHFGRLDVLVIVANYLGSTSPKLSQAGQFFDNFEAVTQINLFASTRLAQMATPHLIESNGVLIIVSPLVERVTQNTIAYCTIKAGLSMLTKTLANCLHGKAVRILNITAGSSLLSMLPNDNSVQGNVTVDEDADEVANLIGFLASSEASYVHGCTIDAFKRER